MDRVKVGVIGCGNISGQYLKNARTFPILNVVAVADLDCDRAAKVAQEHGVPRSVTVDQLLADPEIEIVINLTVPAAHAEVAMRCIEAGKHVVSEKPLATNRDDAKALLAAAKKKRLRVGCAPDTFLGAGHQTARKLIDEGAIGRPVAATAYFMNRGMEGWHPSPEFFFKPGGGPMLDMGPYYLTDLMQMLGPITRVTGTTSWALGERVVGSGPLKGQKIQVEVADHVTGTAEFANGCVATLIMSWATWNARQPSPITIYGTDGTLMVPDPNGFDGKVYLWKQGAASNDFTEAPFTHTLGYGRSVGVADLAYAIREKRDHRASGERAYAVLDAMLGFLDSGQTGKPVKIKAKYERPAPLPTGLPLGQLD
jgi:predicted dehydrogenase